jgi:hypothetical protein
MNERADRFIHFLSEQAAMLRLANTNRTDNLGRVNFVFNHLLHLQDGRLMRATPKETGTRRVVVERTTAESPVLLVHGYSLKNGLLEFNKGSA